MMCIIISLTHTVLIDLRALGFIPKLTNLLDDSEADIRLYAAWVLGTAVQNNSNVQKDVSE